MMNSCQNSGPYNPAHPQTHCALLTPAFSDPHYASAVATKAGGVQIMKHLKLARGGRRRKTKSMRNLRRELQQMGGNVICPAAIPLGSSSWPTFANQNGPFSTAQNANTASQTNNALSASTKAQAMYDHEASNIPSGLQGTPLTGGFYGKSRKKTARKKTARKKTARKKTACKKTARRHSGGHQDRWRTWGCSSGGGAHGGKLYHRFRKHLDMLRHKIPYP